MALAALIIALLSFVMVTILTIVFLARNVFSTHRVQLVPAEQFMPQAPQQPELDFTEFDAPSAMDIAIKNKMRPKTTA